MQGEGFALAKPGADEDFEEVGEWVVDDGAVAQEGDGLGGCLAGKVRFGRARQGRVAGRVVLQAALPDGVAEGAGQRRDKAADRGRAAACGELLVDEAGGSSCSTASSRVPGSVRCGSAEQVAFDRWEGLGDAEHGAEGQ